MVGVTPNGDEVEVMEDSTLFRTVTDFGMVEGGIDNKDVVPVQRLPSNGKNGDNAGVRALEKRDDVGFDDVHANTALESHLVEEGRGLLGTEEEMVDGGEGREGFIDAVVSIALF